VESRKRGCRRPKWRGKRSLGWVPFRDGVVKIDGEAVVYSKQRFKLWLHRPVDGDIRGGSFSQDAMGRWYLNLQCEVEQIEASALGAIGIDLGLKTLATCSDGRKIENLRHAKTWAEKLATAQRAGRKRRVRAIHRKIANARRHQHHVETTRLATQYALIVVGNVNSAKLKRTRMAKSVSDAGWSLFRNMLRYKVAMRRGAEFEERSERYSTQTCSECGCLGGPKGREGLVVREWTCRDCGASHDRDVNAARNILLGPEHRPPRAGIAAVANVLPLSEARALKNRRHFHAVGLYDPTLGAWLSKEHQIIMGPYRPSLPCGRVPADIVELPCDTGDTA
jgi:transposase